VDRERERECGWTGVGWVEPRFIEARPTSTAEALGGPHGAVRRSTPPYNLSTPVDATKLW
jgi:hypothetical protein